MIKSLFQLIYEMTRVIFTVIGGLYSLISYLLGWHKDNNQFKEIKVNLAKDRNDLIETLEQQKIDVLTQYNSGIISYDGALNSIKELNVCIHRLEALGK